MQLFSKRYGDFYATSPDGQPIPKFGKYRSSYPRSIAILLACLI